MPHPANDVCAQAARLLAPIRSLARPPSAIKVPPIHSAGCAAFGGTAPPNLTLASLLVL